MPRGELSGVRNGRGVSGSAEAPSLVDRRSSVASADTKRPGCPVSAVRSGERRLNVGSASGRSVRITSCTTARGQFPRSGLMLWRARLNRRDRSAQREPRLSLCGAASQMSKARMQRCGSGSRTNPPVFSGRKTGKSLKPPPVVGLADEDGNVRIGEPAESLAPVRPQCDSSSLRPTSPALQVGGVARPPAVADAATLRYDQGHGSADVVRPR